MAPAGFGSAGAVSYLDLSRADIIREVLPSHPSQDLLCRFDDRIGGRCSGE